MSTETNVAAGRSSSTTDNNRTVKKQRTGSVEDEVISEFNLMPLTKNKKKLDAQIWSRYLSFRRAQQRQMERNLKRGSDDEESDCSSDEEDEDELIYNDPNLYAWRKLKDELDCFTCDGFDEMDSTLTDQFKKSLHFSVSGASYEDEESLRGVETALTFFSPFAIPRAVQVSMDHYLRARYSYTEHHHKINIQLLNFNPEKKDPKTQTLASYQLDPQRMNVKNLTEKKVTQLCKHLYLDSEDVNLRYILMKILLFSSDWVGENDGGGYVLDDCKLQNAEGEAIEKRNLRRQYGWLEYNLRNSSKKVNAYHSCYEFEKVQQEESDDEFGGGDPLMSLMYGM